MGYIAVVISGDWPTTERFDVFGPEINQQNIVTQIPLAAQFKLQI